MLTPLLTLVATVAVLLAAVWLCQRRLIYFLGSQDVPPVDSILPGAEDISFDTPDGLRLSGWFAPPTATVARAAVLVFNGNAGDRSFRAPLAAALNQAALLVLLFDYRGYGRNPGRPSEKGLVTDARSPGVCRLARRGGCWLPGLLRRVARGSGGIGAGSGAPAGCAGPSLAVHLVDRHGPPVLPIPAHQPAPARSVRLAWADRTPHLPGSDRYWRPGPHRPPEP